ncbi:ADP-ribosyl-[dinitrogen reductase] hydrolase [Halothiobacillus sp.]|uniref:ADP-ribosyl-[dinitrogen reductase] hydrolase n=1 Tax=Halothiobacillus sp. TaxID=1891311 RepID=UPI00261CE58A|nr:ADP-ribosyl-[dinitrogen reductase] hydrolase [Halothiobacillus sp.]
MENTLRDRALGAYLGLAVGDALGATVEFMVPREIQAEYGVHQHMIGGGWLRLKPGEVTDDTQMSLALGDSILAGAEWSLQRFANGMAAWLKSNPVDVGNTCRRGIRRYLVEQSLEGTYSEWDAGNGAAVRNLPAVLATLDDESAFEHISLAQAHFTHHNMLSDAAILSMGRMTRRLLQGGNLSDVASLAQKLVDQHREFRYEPYNGLSSAYVVDTVNTVLHYVLSTNSFKDCLIAIVNQGGDADSTGALGGMLAGAYYGVSAIPREWLRQLRPEIRSAIHEQVDGLLAWRAGVTTSKSAVQTTGSLPIPAACAATA